MKKFILFLALALSLPTVIFASQWSIDPDHSSVGFKVRHLMVSNVKGVFEKVSGTVTLDDANFAGSRVEAIIDTASVNTNVAKRDEHLRTPDFFDAKKYPTMRFVSKIISGANGRYTVTGNLTIRGITKKVVLTVDGPSAEAKDPWGGIRRGLTATAHIDRKDFGVGATYGGSMVGEDIGITLEIELIKKK